MTPKKRPSTHFRYLHPVNPKTLFSVIASLSAIEGAAIFPYPLKKSQS